MIHWFLSLFRAYRDLAESEANLRAAMREADSIREQAQAECAGWREQCMWMRDAMVAAQSEARTAMQAVANIEYQRHYGWTPFPQSPSIPEKWMEDQQNADPIARHAVPLPFQQRNLAYDRFRQQGMEMAEKLFRDESA